MELNMIQFNYNIFIYRKFLRLKKYVEPYIPVSSGVLRSCECSLSSPAKDARVDDVGLPALAKLPRVPPANNSLYVFINSYTHIFIYTARDMVGFCNMKMGTVGGVVPSSR